MSNVTVALDAGHGGSDPGAVYNGRREKDDALRLANAVGKILEMNGVNVYYVRTGDEYETPFKKATDANNAGADLFVSIHRNSSERSNQYSGIQSLVYRNTGIRKTLAENINRELSDIGFENLGIVERPNLVVLKRTQMPAVLVEAGFINSDTDNKIFDNNFDEIARAIADGILETIYSNMSKTDAYGEDETETYAEAESEIPAVSEMPQQQTSDLNDDFYQNSEIDNINSYPDERQTDDRRSAAPENQTGTRNQTGARRQNEFYCDCNEENEKLYRVQVGAYRNKENADRMLDALLIEGFPAFMLYDDGYYKVQVGAFSYLTNAIKMEQRLRRFRYNTYIVYN